MYHTVFSNKMTRITLSKSLPHNTKDMGISFQKTGCHGYTSIYMFFVFFKSSYSAERM